MSRSDDAKDLFNQGFNCAQAVCGAYAGQLGSSREEGLRVSAAFGGGVGRTGQTCGAVSGALMALGLKYGMVEASPEAKDRMYNIAQEFLKRFSELHGTVQCRELLRADLTTVEGRAAIKVRKTHSTVCTGLIEDASAILDDMLAE